MHACMYIILYLLSFTLQPLYDFTTDSIDHSETMNLNFNTIIVDLFHGDIVKTGLCK